MFRLKRIGAAATALVMMANLIGDKIMDAIVAISTDGGLSRDEIFPLFLRLSGIVLALLILQSGIFKLISDLMRKFRRTDEVDEMRATLRDARVTIKHGLEYLKSQQNYFNRKVLSASRQVQSLEPMDAWFLQNKDQAANTVISLKDDYRDSIDTLERTIDQLYKDLADAEVIFMEAEEWSQQAADDYYTGPS